MQASILMGQASCISTLEQDMEEHASQLKLERCKAEKLHTQLKLSVREIAWLRSRVCQLQQSQHARNSVAARECADMSSGQSMERFPLQQRQHDVNF